MSDVSIRDLRNRGGEIVDRATSGERITITRSGEPVAELTALTRHRLSGEALLQRWRRLPPVDDRAMRREVDGLLDASL